MIFKHKNHLALLFSSLFLVFVANAQISSVDADASEVTEYSSGSQDNVYIFCAAPEETEGMLTAEFQAGGVASFEWLKYNPVSGSFDFFQTDNPGGAISTINNLESGGYRVSVTSGGITETYTAWVFNSWYAAIAEITESTCDYFQLLASFEGTDMIYYDLSNGQEKQVFKDVRAKWEVDGYQVSAVLSPQVFNPPPRNTDYTLTVYDRFGCEVELIVAYNSIVTEASFIATPMSGEAPLEVTFTSASENADEYEWSFFRDVYELQMEGQQNGAVSDSIMKSAIDENPVFIYDESGTYDVKLVTSKYSDFGVCSDTVYLEGYVVADTSFVDVPNVFTPNGDGDNDEFVVSYWSLKEISVKMFNRWGKQIFEWENNNVQGFENTVSESVWNGKIGGRYASPGVYYYVIEAVGRDGKERNAHGFVHLFRGK